VTDGRKRSTALAALLIAVGSLGLHAATPAAAEPNIDTVKQRVDRLYEQAEKASERYNAAKEQLKASQVRLKALNADLSRQRRVVDDMRGEVATMVVDQYQGEGLSTASQVVFSSDAESFLDNLNAISSYNSQRGQVVREYGVQLKQLKLRKALPTTRSPPSRRPARCSRTRRPRSTTGRQGQGLAEQAQGEAAAGAPEATEARRRAGRPGRPRGPRRPIRRRPWPVLRSATPWRRSVTPTSGARPGPAPTTAPG
jgi:hypothetical protein